MAGKLTVVLSQAQGKNPAKRALEEELAAALMMDEAVEVSLVPHLIDMPADHPGLLYLRGVPGDLVVLSWLYPRAAFWTLDRQGVRGRFGPSNLHAENGEGEDGSRPRHRPDAPARTLTCLDLRGTDDAGEYLGEIKKIAAARAKPVVTLGGLASGGRESAEASAARTTPPPADAGGSPRTFDAPAPRRWYPVIDYARCTNCLECVDFCLFGVYGLDEAGSVLVEQQDSCKKGCPACSRVCPANAIVFPGHKTPAIAGADDAGAGDFKIDLSKLFGAADADPLKQAAAERDVELLRDGRDAVGMDGMDRLQKAKDRPRDDLDGLLDNLDALAL